MAEKNFQCLRASVTAKPRISVMEDREYIVLPVVILMEGVHSGSNGPTLYLLEDMEKYCPAWNHKPIVVYHPKQGDTFVSADNPKILNESKVGLLMSNQISGNGQKAEAWLEKSRLEKVDKRILEAIEKGLIVEVSTGLFTDNEDLQGEWNGETYNSVARDYRPDHLALLPDLVGACSIEDGCGLFTASQAISREKAEEVQQVVTKALKAVNKEGEDSDKTVSDFAFVPDPNDPTTWSLPIHNEKSLGETITALAEKKVDIPEELLLGVKSKALSAYSTLHPKEDLETVANQLSFEQSSQKLWEKLIKPLNRASDTGYYYLTETYSDFAIYVFEGDGTLFRQDYKVNKDDEVELVGEPQKVKREISYKVISSNNKKEKPNMAKLACKCTKEIKSLVDSLISNGQSWSEEDREYLESQDEKMLKRFQAMESDPVEEEVAEEEESVPAPKANTVRKKKQQSPEEYINAAPAEVQELLRHGLAAHQAERKRLTDIILANESNSFTEQELAVMKPALLKKMADLAVQEETPVETQSLDLFNYIGQVGGPSVNTNQEQALPLPRMSFDKK